MGGGLPFATFLMRNHRKTKKTIAFKRLSGRIDPIFLRFVMNLRNPVKIPRNLAMSLPESNMAGRLTDRALVDRPWHGPKGR
ncbi:hypothetical protein ATY75_14535 [Rhizobium sp. N122]|uniref:hypothetical protein n=1 Tax=Rhizobium sp. N122 TaxID=1764272 RepID=UPI000B5A3D02|nr:hypothetical protein [Rhizobium sp. N122]OWV90426.1 hypothetical protein ATY75_14535 [Rhizobium sp. N122]